MIEIQGRVRQPLTLTVDQLRANYPAQTVDIEFANDTRTVMATYTGARLWDIIQSADVTPPLRVEARARDDFRCLLKWDEIDPNAPDSRLLLVAYERDGEPLSEKDGPLRLVVPGDATGVRYLRGLQSLNVLDMRHATNDGDS